jgi:hypothetical protein
MLNSREEATITLVTLIIVALAFLLGRRRLVQACAPAIKAAANPTVLRVLFFYSAAVVTLTFAASKLGIWDWSLIKDTTILAIFSGIPTLVSQPLKADSSAQLVKNILKATLGISAIAAAYVNFTTFSYPMELLLQIATTIVVIGTEVGKRHLERVHVVKFFSVIQLGLGILLATSVAIYIIKNITSSEITQQLRLAAFSAYLPIALIPFSYSLAFIAAAETKLKLLSIHNRNISNSTKLAVLLGFRWSLQNVREFYGQQLLDAAHAASSKELSNIMQRHREVVKRNGHLNRQRNKRLKKLAGVPGRDQRGAWIDRREFDETKSALTNIYCTELGLYRNRPEHHYHKDTSIVFDQLSIGNLPAPHGIHLEVQDDLQAWYAWRQTIGGCYLAIGGSSNIEVRWHYSAKTAPTSFPCDNNSEWINSEHDAANIDWSIDDRPVHERY